MYLKCLITVLALFLLPPPVVLADDFDVKFLYVQDGIKWGMSTSDLKRVIEGVTCELEDGEMTCTTVSKSLDPLLTSFLFKKDRLSSLFTIVPIRKPFNLETLLAEMQLVSEVKPISVANVSEPTYYWRLKHSTCNSQLNTVSNNVKALTTSCRPSPYIATAMLEPAKDSFKPLGMIFGKSTLADVLTIAKNNGWWARDIKYENKTTVYLAKLGMDGIMGVEVFLYEDHFQSVTYRIDPKYDNKESFYKLLVKKYGKQQKNESSYYVWEIDKGTSDEISIVMSYNKKPSNITSISYSMTSLSQKELEVNFYEYSKKQSISEDMKSKAF
ncbi:MAG: hypothetical protein A4E71_02557 [Smithella sp. PtaU1.Bin162]|nr:MAG: hypothetical protein A4E71_02557 [Smithella sp. PtaU1.Bin162]